MTDPGPGPSPPEEFRTAAAAMGIEFEPGDLERLGRFLGLLLEANKTTNLTGITDPAQAWTKHVLDALTIVPVLASVEEGVKVSRCQGVKGGAEASVAPPSTPRHHDTSTPVRPDTSTPLSVIDVGSGGGVPGIPLAIVMPGARFTLLEATGKKAEFLKRTVGELGLTNVQVVQARAEAVGQEHKANREKYDAAIARALGHLAVVVELCGPLVRPGGVVVAVKGAKAEAELAESAKALGLIGLVHSETITTPTGRLVVLQKTIRTPRLYPRRDGEPARLPLGTSSR